jgi:hypothetical protein
VDRSFAPFAVFARLLQLEQGKRLLRELSKHG